MRTIITGALVVLAAFVVAACSDDKSAGPADATFTYASQNAIVSDLDPATSYSAEGIVMPNIYEQLTRYDSSKGAVTPLLATRWTSANGGRTWTFTLRKGVRFHTGKPLTAEAAKASILRTKQLAGGAAYIWDAVKSIETPSPTTLVFRLSYPAPLDVIAASGFGAHIYDTTAAGSDDLAKWFQSGKDAGSGPYTIAQWNKGEENELRLKQYKPYWGGWEGRHYTSALYKYVPEPTTRLQLLKQGEADFTPLLSPQLFEQVQSEDELEASTQSSFQNLIAFLNTASGPLEDERLRKAVALAIDYQGIVTALKGSAAPASGFVPEGLLGYTPGLEYRQDVEQARQLVEASGQEGVKLTLTHAAGEPDEAVVATLMKSNLAEIGIDLEVKSYEFQTQWDRGKSKDPAKRQDIFVMYWYPDYPDAYSWFANLFRSADPPFFNLSYLADEEVDRTIDGLQALSATSRAEAEDTYASLQRSLLDRAVAVPLYVTRYQRVFAKGLEGYVDDPAYPLVVFVHSLRPPAS